MYQAGTLSGNPLAMVAGIKTLEILDRPGAYEHLDAVTGKLIKGLLQAGRDAGHEVCGGHISGEVSAQRLLFICRTSHASAVMQKMQERSFIVTLQQL